MGLRLSKLRVEELVEKEINALRALELYQDEPVSISAYLLKMRNSLKEALDEAANETERHALPKIKRLLALGTRCLMEFGAPE